MPATKLKLQVQDLKLDLFYVISVIKRVIFTCNDKHQNRQAAKVNITSVKYNAQLFAQAFANRDICVCNQF